jgi:hypothetical protein
MCHSTFIRRYRPTFGPCRKKGRQTIAIGTNAGVGAAATNSSNLAVGTFAGQRVDGNSNAAFGQSAGQDVGGHNNTAAGRDAGSFVIGEGNAAYGLRDRRPLNCEASHRSQA